MEYSNSKLITCTKLSPNYSSGRKTINRITPHHTATGPITAAKIGEIFATSTRGASCNYGIGTDGSACLIVEEKNRAWTSSSRANDEQAITFEISNSAYGEPWAISDKAYAKFIDMAVDICQRYGATEVFNIEKELAGVEYGRRGDFANNYPVPAGKILLTQHNYFSATACPGTYIKQHFDQICADINARLSGVTPTPTPEPTVEVAQPTLYKGCKGAEVKKLQQNLISLGYSCGKWGADGSFGNATRAAVIAFQKDAFPSQPIEWDGIYGNKSYSKMKERLKK